MNDLTRFVVRCVWMLIALTRTVLVLDVSMLDVPTLDVSMRYSSTKAATAIPNLATRYGLTPIASTRRRMMRYVMPGNP